MLTSKLLSQHQTITEGRRRPSIGRVVGTKAPLFSHFLSCKNSDGRQVTKTATICLEYRGSGGKGALHLMWFLEVIRQHFNTLCQWRSSLSGLFSSTLFQPVLLRPPLFFFFFSPHLTPFFIYTLLSPVFSHSAWLSPESPSLLLLSALLLLPLCCVL